MLAEVRNLSKKFGEVRALNNVSFTLRAGAIYGLFGRNGAGKTTLMSMLTAQSFPTSGTVRIFGVPPFENRQALRRTSFVREGQKYPEEASVNTLLRTGPLFYRDWDTQFAQELVERFELPPSRPLKKLSRGQLSAAGIVLGLSSRAELTFFDEPNLGLDAVARQVFYAAVAEDFAAHPRTVVISSHLIDEVAPIVEHVLLLNRGKLVVDMPTDQLSHSAYRLTGPGTLVADFVGAGMQVLQQETLGGLSRVTVRADFTAEVAARARAVGLDAEAISLQELSVLLGSQK